MQSAERRLRHSKKQPKKLPRPFLSTWLPGAENDDAEGGNDIWGPTVPFPFSSSLFIRTAHINKWRKKLKKKAESVTCSIFTLIKNKVHMHVGTKKYKLCDFGDSSS